jgi:hypothetical protein
LNRAESFEAVGATLEELRVKVTNSPDVPLSDGKLNE